MSCKGEPLLSPLVSDPGGVTLGVIASPGTGVAMMGWSFRKSKNLGLGIRLNVSSKGIGFSFGPKGSRISIGPRGTWFYGGWGPFRYQRKLSDSSNSQQSSQPQTSQGGSCCLKGCLYLVLLWFAVALISTCAFNRSSREQLATLYARQGVAEPNRPPVPTVDLPPEEPGEANPVYSPRHIEGRRWKDASEKHQTLAKLTGVVGGFVGLEKEADKTTVYVPLDRLCKPDQQYVSEMIFTIKGRVFEVADGDTLRIWAASASEDAKIRLEGIDAPERSQSHSERSRRALIDKVLGEEIAVRWLKKDQCGRLLGQVYCKDRWINGEMVREGWAMQYDGFEVPSLIEAEEKAREEEKGIWVDGQAEPPSEFRRRLKELAEEPARPEPSSSRGSSSYSSRGTGSYGGSSGSIQVKGYYRKDGTYVRPHTRKH